MENQEQFRIAMKLLESVALSFTFPEDNRMDAVITSEKLKSAIQSMVVDSGWGYVAAITGLDVPGYEENEETQTKRIVPDKGEIELLYHIANGPLITTLRLKVPYENASVESICDLVPSVSFYEREAMELLGVTFKNTPDTYHLVLPDNWPAGVFPLRKSFTGLNNSESRIERGD